MPASTKTRATSTRAGNSSVSMRSTAMAACYRLFPRSLPRRRQDRNSAPLPIKQMAYEKDRDYIQDSLNPIAAFPELECLENMFIERRINPTTKLVELWHCEW